MSDHEQVRELLPAYALSCLDPEEEAEVRSHLAECSRCREDLAGYQGVTDCMGLASRSRVPPAALENRIMARVSAGRAAPGAAPAAGASRGPAAGRKPALSRPRWPRLMVPLAAAAAVLIVALAAGNILQAVRSGREAQVPQGVETVALLGTADAHDAYGTVVLDVDQNRGVLAVRGLPCLDAGHQYQLWLIHDGRRTSAGVFSVDAKGYAALMVDVPVEFASFQSMGVSVEPAGGSATPTGSRIMTGKR
jgi:anti-sigma-K factor RskA